MGPGAGSRRTIRLFAHDQAVDGCGHSSSDHVSIRGHHPAPHRCAWIDRAGGRALWARNASAIPSTDNPGSYEVNFTLSTDAARRFGPFTEQNVGRPMAIVLDRKVESAPVIQSRIEDSGRITGRFGQQEANDLALVLRAGALPASIRYLEERTVGPSLGADSIRHGVQASIISLLVVLLFMVFYYRISGVNAVIALLLNLVILLAALAYFGAVLTLPGIAGVILTIGLIANLFTAVYVSRVIFDWHLAKMQRQAALSI
ncbi:MAG: hypothetical protein DMG32_18315 [Acidobacteria bacterium]|nr:MAG: hypothetical protein DMG32_18315 [Acidobacteriota bacterium]